MKAKCPKCKASFFAVFDDANFCSDGEIKKFDLKCLGTESSPCSHCSGNNNNVLTPDPSPPKVKKSEFAQTEGFCNEDCEGEEESHKKMLANACKGCLHDPCVVDDEEVSEEGQTIVKNLNANGITETKPCRFALCRMCACVPGHREKRCMLLRCVCLFVEKHFVEEGKE